MQYLNTDPSPLTPAQQALHGPMSSLLRQMYGLIALAEETDAAVERVEDERTVDASICAADLIRDAIAKVEAQGDAAGIEMPARRRRS